MAINVLGNAYVISSPTLPQEGDVEHGSKDHEQDDHFEDRDAADDEEGLAFVLAKEFLSFGDNRWQVHDCKGVVDS